jgi:hypothetical protein
MKFRTISIILIAACSCGTEPNRISGTDTIISTQDFRPDELQKVQSKESPYISDSCELLAERMMMSTPVFKGLEADTPHWLTPEKEGNSYTYGLYHNFEGHINTIAWIVVDLKKGAVYYHDIPDDTLLPLEFDNSLIAEIATKCK